MNYFFVNLVWVDMMVVIFIVFQYIFLYIYRYFQGFVGDYLCKFFIGGNFMWIGGVVFVVIFIVIVFERYFVVYYLYDEK